MLPQSNGGDHILFKSAEWRRLGKIGGGHNEVTSKKKDWGENTCK